MEGIGQRSLLQLIQQPAQPLDLRQLGLDRSGGSQFLWVHGLREFSEDGDHGIQTADVAGRADQIECGALG
jgi:hypothetical protein